jgi:hypothetical protein
MTINKYQSSAGAPLSGAIPLFKHALFVVLKGGSVNKKIK